MEAKGLYIILLSDFLHTNIASTFLRQQNNIV